MSIDYSSMMFPKEQKGIKNQKRKDVSKSTYDKIDELFKSKCGLCGRQGVHHHHIKYRSESPELIDDLDNLFLLCIECHQKVHSNKKYWQPRLQNLRKKFK